MLNKDLRSRLSVPLLLLMVLNFTHATLGEDTTADCPAAPSDGQWTVTTTVTLNTPSNNQFATEEECPSQEVRTVKDVTEPDPGSHIEVLRFVNEFGRYQLHTTKKSWSEAKKKCEEDGGHLVIINSKGEEKALKKILKGRVGQYDFVFIGASDIESEGNFVTVLGEPFSSVGYANWDEGEPNNAPPGEDCMSMRPSGKINDFFCSAKRSFLCEMPIRSYNSVL